jgi:cation transport ATPase
MVGTILLRGILLPLAIVGHEDSTVIVSLNGLRLLGYREGVIRVELPWQQIVDFLS